MIGQWRPARKMPRMREPASAASILATPIVDLPLRSEIDLPPELLADLNDPRLIITPDYIGIDPRRPGRRPERITGGAGVGLRMRQIVVTALITATTVVPLTLMATGAPTQAQVAHPTAQVLRSTTTPRPALSTTQRVAQAQQRRAASAARSARRVAQAQQRRAASAARTAQRVAQAQQRRAASVARTAPATVSGRRRKLAA
jgi:hypothetical protein